MDVQLKKLKQRRAYFDRNMPKLSGADMRSNVKGLGNTCPSCGYPTLGGRCNHDICSICFWEDDGQDDYDADDVFGGPNASYSLTAHRLEWEEHLEGLKEEQNKVGKQLKRIDQLVDRNDSSDLEEILLLVKSVESWFDAKRK